MKIAVAGTGYDIYAKAVNTVIFIENEK